MDRRTFVKDALIVGAGLGLGAYNVADYFKEKQQQRIIASLRGDISEQERILRERQKDWGEQQKEIDGLQRYDLKQQRITEEKENIRRRIFNELKNCVYVADIIVEAEINRQRMAAEKKGCGIILNHKGKDYFLSVAHITSFEKEIIVTPDEVRVKPSDLKCRKTLVKGIELEEVMISEEEEVSIHRFPKGAIEKLSLRRFPAKPATNYNLGDRVYLIGNPHLRGSETREGIISGINGNKIGLQNMEFEPKHFFETNISATGGDSGVPVVREDFMLLGFVSSYLKDVAVSYIKDLREYFKYLP